MVSTVRKQKAMHAGTETQNSGKSLSMPECFVSLRDLEMHAPLCGNSSGPSYPSLFLESA